MPETFTSSSLKSWSFTLVNAECVGPSDCWCGNTYLIGSFNILLFCDKQNKKYAKVE